MRRPLFLALLCLTAGTAAAQDPQAPPSPPRERRGGGRAVLPVIQLADADRNGEVSAAEWGGFIESLQADESGVFDPTRLRGRLVISILDANQDGELATADLSALFTQFDRDNEGVVKLAEERGNRGRDGGDGTPDGSSRRVRAGNPLALRLGLMVLGAADGDANREVTRAEWDEFVAEVSKAGLTPESLLKALAARASDVGRSLDGMLAGLGADKPNVEGLQAVFKRLDRNDDGALQADEIAVRRGRPEGGPEAPKRPEGGKGEIF
ncbi:MAG: hypothetical protein AB7O52_10550 [Planctomycetota bacterium]